MAHTPGPWNVDGHNGIAVVAGPYGSANLYAHICNCEYGYQKHASECLEIDKSNARLIAAAPELLEALNEARIKLIINFKHGSGEYHGGMEHSVLIRLIDKAIAKATGAL